MDFLVNSPLGSYTKYNCHYDPTLLFPIKRDEARQGLGYKGIDIYGYDVWNAYELSWLNNYGKPETGILRMIVSVDSKSIIESKSLKLYLNSFNNTSFSSKDAVQETISNDIKSAVEGNVIVEIIELTDQRLYQIKSPPGINIDSINIDIDWNKVQGVDSSLLTTEDIQVNETLHSNILRSNCLVTGQPDFGTLVIEYSGNKIDKASLLAYIASYRNHKGFHEQCVERAFFDIMETCMPISLSVHAHYTRRGGIDICPYRSSVATQTPDYMRFIRQ